MEYQFSDDEKLNAAQSFMEGQAQEWFHKIQSRFPFQSWERLRKLLLLRFANDDDPEKIHFHIERKRFLQEFRDSIKQHGSISRETEAIEASESIQASAGIKSKSMEKHVIPEKQWTETDSILEVDVVHREVSLMTRELMEEEELPEETETIPEAKDSCSSTDSNMEFAFVHQQIAIPMLQGFDQMFLRVSTRRTKKKLTKSWKFKFKNRPLTHLMPPVGRYTLIGGRSIKNKAEKRGSWNINEEVLSCYNMQSNEKNKLGPGKKRKVCKSWHFKYKNKFAKFQKQRKGYKTWIFKYKLRPKLRAWTEKQQLNVWEQIDNSKALTNWLFQALSLEFTYSHSSWDFHSSYFGVQEINAGKQTKVPSMIHELNSSLYYFCKAKNARRCLN
ncbi:unnamed protein product [Arabis nemorensis]|uniref:Retrotransposon gag domain-containing protein n=1 Tax=Arabis nemorensis TaxID=586526 RepID=A0A565CG76_9BRAS|nr:unnamed protein product [Arabis nemorensis]